MRLTSTQEKVFQILKKEIEQIKESMNKWGIALIGPYGYGKTLIMKKIKEELSDESSVFVYLDLCIPDICPEGKNVNWEEYFKQLKDILPQIEFEEIDKIKSLSEKMEKLSLLCKKHNKRIFIIFDHLEECKDWRVARWPIESGTADVILASDVDAWNEKECDRVTTSFFIKKVYLNEPFDLNKDKEIFLEILSRRFRLNKEAIEKLLEYVSQKVSEGKTPSWFDIFREADEMEENKNNEKEDSDEESGKT
jgi:hypothetical protein